MRQRPLPDKPRLLVITNALPDRRSSSGEQRLIRLCALLMDRCQVSVVATTPLADDETRARAEYLRSLGAIVPEHRSTPALRNTLIRNRYEGVIIEFWHVALDALPSVRRWQPWARVVIDTVDLEFVRDARGTDFSHGRDPSAISRRKELELETYAMADGLIFVSGVEQGLYRTIRDRPEQTWVVPNVVVLRSRTKKPRAPVLLFVGSFWHAPNVDAIVWFTRELWPEIRNAFPDATLHVAGSHIWDKVARLGDIPGVVVLGFVEDLAVAYDDAAVAVAPLRWGAGMKGKVCDALASAVPLVASTIGIEGLRLRPGTDVLVADGPGDFVGAVTMLLNDQAKAERIGTAGQVAIGRQCLPAAIHPALGQVVDFLTEHRHSQLPKAWWARAATREGVSAARRNAKRVRSWITPGSV
ncbi:MAG TPA: glycosyltransferase family 4 protein [Acidimicrobiales bacterium]|jgi:glycosyltransferase involved in cell wall biosynthesis|nr:glycosyltransferase family 4 protein [Acidimicrobiales bacterium]